MARWAAVPYRDAERTTRRGYRLINRMISPVRPQARSEWAALVEGLLATPAAIPPKYFYDSLGCTLFQAICELPEYYLTRTERAIFTTHTDTIAAVAGRGRQFVDLGAGDCAKGILAERTTASSLHSSGHRGGRDRASTRSDGRCAS